MKGFSGAKLIKLIVTLSNGKVLLLVIKQVVGEVADAVKNKGFTREATFYKELAKDLNTKVP